MHESAPRDATRTRLNTKEQIENRLAKRLCSGQAHQAMVGLLVAARTEALKEPDTREKAEAAAGAPQVTETRTFERWLGVLVARLERAVWDDKAKPELRSLLENEGLELRPGECDCLQAPARARFAAQRELHKERLTAEDVRYAAFYALCMRARRDNQLEVYDEVLELPMQRGWMGFLERGSYWHLRSMHLSARHDTGDLERARSDAVVACDANPNHAGFLHNHAEITAKLAEDGLLTPDDGSESERMQMLHEALERATKVTRLESGYPKFWATRARLLTLLGRLSEAEAAVLTALRNEHRAVDSATRRAEYRAVLSEVRIAKEAERITAELKADGKEAAEAAEQNLRKYAEETKIRHVEFLGFFAGVLSLIGISVQAFFKTASDPGKSGLSATPVALPPTTVAASLLMLAGILLVAFGGLGWLLRGESFKAVLRSLAVVILGITVFLTGLFAAGFLEGPDSAAVRGTLPVSDLPVVFTVGITCALVAILAAILLPEPPEARSRRLTAGRRP
jgi:hypothetical protein